MTVRVQQRRNPDAEKAFKALLNSYVVVGIPEGEADRSDNVPMNNAQIGYLNEYGTSDNRPPARSWLHKPLESIQASNVARLEATSKAALTDVKNAKTIIDKGLTRVGLESVNKIIQTIVAHIYPPLAPSTVAARLEKRPNLKAKFDKARKAGFINEDSELQKAQNVSELSQFFTPLVDTGSFKSSITFAIRRN